MRRDGIGTNIDWVNVDFSIEDIINDYLSGMSYPDIQKSGKYINPVTGKSITQPTIRSLIPLEFKRSIRGGLKNYYKINPKEKIFELDLELIKKHHHEEELTPKEIALIYGCSESTVFKFMVYNGLHPKRNSKKSSHEREIISFLKDSGVINIIQSTNRILQNKRELDIYLPEHSLAIEINGIYWHSIDKDNMYREKHFDKFIECMEKGIILLQFTDVDIETNKDKVFSLILSHIDIENKSDITYSSDSVIWLDNDDSEYDWIYVDNRFIPKWVIKDKWNMVDDGKWSISTFEQSKYSRAFKICDCGFSLWNKKREE